MTGDCATIAQPKLLEKLADLFNEADRDHSGSLDYEELRSFIKVKGESFPQLEMMSKEILGSMKPDEALSLDQFKKLMAQADSKLRALPATAQVAAQEGAYIGALLSSHSYETINQDLSSSNVAKFGYNHLGCVLNVWTVCCSELLQVAGVYWRR